MFEQSTLMQPVCIKRVIDNERYHRPHTRDDSSGVECPIDNDEMNPNSSDLPTLK